MSLEDLNVDPTMGSNDISWWGLDINPQFPAFDSPDLAFDTTAFGLQNEQSLRSSSTSTDFGFNQHFPPTFDSPDLSFDASLGPAFDFGQFAHLSSTSTDFTSIVPNINPSFSYPSTVAPAVVNEQQPPSQFVGASPFMQFQPTPAPAPPFPHTGALLRNIAPLVNTLPSNASSSTVVPGNTPQHIPAASNASSQPTATPVAPQHIPATGNASSQPTATPVAPQHIPATGNALPQPTATPVTPWHMISATSNASPSSQPGPTTTGTPPVSLSKSTQPAAAPSDASSPPPESSSASLNQVEIGRASCRERVWTVV